MGSVRKVLIFDKRQRPSNSENLSGGSDARVKQSYKLTILKNPLANYFLGSKK
jgi:hypothetical protein